MSDTSKLKSRISTLNHLLDDLDSQLDPLLAQSLPESLLQLDTIQQAKLQVTVPYLVYDLIISLYNFMPPFLSNSSCRQHTVYLKTNGIDPRTHPVFTELVCQPSSISERVLSSLSRIQERVRQYIEKISTAENPETS